MLKNEKPRILAVVGSTASGKSALALALAERLGLPADMTPNALLAALRVVTTYEEYKRAVAAL